MLMVPPPVSVTVPSIAKSVKLPDERRFISSLFTVGPTRVRVAPFSMLTVPSFTNPSSLPSNDATVTVAKSVLVMLPPCITPPFKMSSAVSLIFTVPPFIEPLSFSVESSFASINEPVLV